MTLSPVKQNVILAFVLFVMHIVSAFFPLLTRPGFPLSMQVAEHIPDHCFLLLLHNIKRKIIYSHIKQTHTIPKTHTCH